MFQNKSQNKQLKQINQIRFSPPQMLSLGFLIMIVVGALLLMLPISLRPGKSLSFLNALFEATSAVCVTGLVVTDTGTTFTVFGQTVLLLLIQVGGLGFMTFGILVAMLLGKKISLSNRLMAQSAMNQFNLSGIVKLVKLVLVMTLVIEGAGALLLTITWAREMPLGWAIYYGIFHSISSFNNAGFDIMGDYASMTAYVGSWPVNLVLSFLYILGGLGFTVILEVVQKIRKWRWSLHTRIVMGATLLLNLVASVLFFLLERHNPLTLGSLPLGDQILASYFQGTVPRTAGFNTVDLTQMNSDSVLLMMGLMFIGGSSGSTAGGIKITTFFLLLLVVWTFIKQREDVTILRKRIPKDLVFRALAISMIGIGLVFTGSFLLEVTEKGLPLMNLAFEAVSAFGTVGLTLGVTPNLSEWGKIIIMLLMFVGRLGPLTIALALTRSKHDSKLKYPEEKILIG
ncbi:Ktr system potassium transporter B [Paenibacillus yonginensis]|uniref:Ktr system potassium transporter B n=1 Tax=Paenibacillus yonginensis TaxID=1462996 RepID=A0A1B1MYN7_9BACL|nr:TrkH family potassium uptake protein [Paenibacillus yonginensis]ANS74259.1 Ktr system potassium transporter B [Paenibacillus yonginensis]